MADGRIGLIIGIIFIGVSSIYLIYWLPRWLRYQRIQMRLHRALKTPKWSPELREVVLEQARGLSVGDPVYHNLLMKLVGEGDFRDPRVLGMIERYLLRHAPATLNAGIRSAWARIIPVQPIHAGRLADALNVGAMMDGLSREGLAQPDDLDLYARWAADWTLFLPDTVEAVWQVWHQAPENHVELLAFLCNWLFAVWPFPDTWDASRRTVWTERAAQCLQHALDQWPGDSSLHQIAVAADYASGDFVRAYQNAQTTRNRFGPEGLERETWRLWGKSVCALEHDDWTAYAEGRSNRIPLGRSSAELKWQRLCLIMEKAYGVDPADDEILTGLAWTYVGSAAPLQQVRPVYEALTERQIYVGPALFQMAQNYRQQKQWVALAKVCRFILSHPDEAAHLQSVAGIDLSDWLAEAVVEGALEDDKSVFERAFDHSPAYAGLNLRLARLYVGQETLSSGDVQYVERLLPHLADSPELQQQLRETFLLAVIRTPVPGIAAATHAEGYVDAGGQHPAIMDWTSEHLGGGRKVAALELLIAQRPVDLHDCYALGKDYQRQSAPPTKSQFKALADAAQSAWSPDGDWNDDDLALAGLLYQRDVLARRFKQRLLRELLMRAGIQQSEDERALARALLAQSIAEGWVELDMLRTALSRFFNERDPDPVHIQALETCIAKDEACLMEYGLRLLWLYDQGNAVEGGSREDAGVAGQYLAIRMANVITGRSVPEDRRVFASLFQRLCASPAETVDAPHASLVCAGIEREWMPVNTQTAAWLRSLAQVLAERGDARAVDLADWLYRNGRDRAQDALAFLTTAAAFDRAKTDDPQWYDVAQIAWRGVPDANKARDFLVEALKARREWTEEDISLATALIKDPAARSGLALAYVQRVPYDRAVDTDEVLIELVDANPELAEGNVNLLWSAARRRDEDGRTDAALDLYLLVDGLQPFSEPDLHAILPVLARARQPGRFAPAIPRFLDRYPASFALRGQLIPLVRDSTRPLPFGLAQRIADEWAAMVESGAGKEEGVDASWVAQVKVTLYRNYLDELNSDQNRAMLESIMRHAGQPLGESRGLVVEVCQQVLANQQVDDDTRKVVAEGLWYLGDYDGAARHLEYLAQRPAHRKTAIRNMTLIARQLENPLRQIPALLTCYRHIAEAAYQDNEVGNAEEVVSKAYRIITNDAVMTELGAEDRRRAELQRDPALKLYQRILEVRHESARLSLQDLEILGSIYRMRGLWNQAGRAYNTLAEAYKERNDRSHMVESAELLLESYYRAGKAWWDLAASQTLRLLIGIDRIPSHAEVETMTQGEIGLLEAVAVLYHALYVDLTADLGQRKMFHFKAENLYGMLPFSYLEPRSYLRELKADLSERAQRITHPLERLERFRNLGGVQVGPSRRYELQDLLGEGGFSRVYKAVDTETGKVYAMKVLSRHDPEAEARFEKEGRYLRDLDHPNIVRCIEYGVHTEGQYMLMELVDGPTLEDLLARDPNLPLEVRLRIFLDICNAVAYVHDQGVLHRDLHPRNVMLSGSNHETVKLTDFGLATLLKPEGVGKSSRVDGRMNYTAPEILESEPDTPASEIFSLGAILCLLLARTPRLDAPTLEMLRSERFYHLGDVVERALRTRAKDRYQSVTELIRDVKARMPAIQHSYTAMIQNLDERRFSQLFELEEEIGRGESGIVYKARDLRKPGRQVVAVKAVDNQWVSRALERRVEEFYRIRDLDHPNIVGLQAFFRTADHLYVVMEYVRGQSLAAMLESYAERRQRFPGHEALKITLDIARALACIHSQGIIHGAVLPSNILMDSAAKRARLSDFATAILYDGDRWHKSAMLRPYNHYLAPELETGAKLSPACDVYTAGWLLCQLATGQSGRVLPDDMVAALYELGDLSDEQRDAIAEVIQGCTINKPEDRPYQDGGTLVAALEHIMSF